MSTNKVDNDKKTKKQSKYLSKKNVILLTVALLLFFVIILLSPIFGMSEIEITGASLYSQEELNLYFSDFKDKNGFVALFENTTFSQLDGFFSGRMTEKENELLFDYPLIKNATIEYSFPNKLEVKIEERTPMMVTEVDEMYLQIDSEGYLLGAYAEVDRIGDMPLIKGIEISDYKVGAPIADGNNKNISSAIKICSIMKQLSMLSYIDIIDVTDYNNICMHCSPLLTIEFGNTDETGRKLSYIKGIIDEGYDGQSDGVLDVSSGGNPIFRENSEDDKTEIVNPDNENMDENGNSDESSNSAENGDSNDEDVNENNDLHSSDESNNSEESEEQDGEDVSDNTESSDDFEE